MVTRVLTKLESGIEEFRENFNKELEGIIKKHTEMKNIVTEMKNRLEETNTRLANTEEWVNNLEYRLVEINQSAHQKEKII